MIKNLNLSNIFFASCQSVLKTLQNKQHITRWRFLPAFSTLDKYLWIYYLLVGALHANTPWAGDNCNWELISNFLRDLAMATPKKWNLILMPALRILLGALFVFSGYMKLLDMEEFIRVIYKINFISYDGAATLAILIIGFELLLGALLILGLFIKQTLLLTLFMLIGFTAFLAVVLIFKLEVKGCGCFGKLSKSQITYWEILRNLFLISITGLLILKMKICHRLSIDGYNKPGDGNHLREKRESLWSSHE